MWTREERWEDDTRQQGKGGKEDDMTGEGPRWLNTGQLRRMGCSRAVDLGSSIVAVGKLHPRFRTPPPPPPPLKGRKAGGGGGGVRNGLHRR
jgi:hypothetical protein